MMILIKLGGSVITDKRKPKFARRKVLYRLAREIKRTKKRVIIVHGAGSFGHITAEKYNLDKGYSYDSQIEGFSITHRNVRILNNIVLDSLIGVEIPAVSIQPLSFIEKKNGSIALFDDRWIRIAIDIGLTPLTFGDVVFDSVKGFSICSGDSIMEEIANRFDIERAIFVMDEDGIYSENPKTSKTAKLLTEIDSNNLSKVNTRENEYSDVTEGMKGKLRSISNIAREGIEVRIVNGNKKDRTYKAILGKKTIGTIVYGGII